MSKIKVVSDTESNNGLIANNATQPINTYSIVERSSFLPVKNALRTIPKIALPQTIPNNVQPIQLFNTVKQKGV